MLGPSYPNWAAPYVDHSLSEFSIPLPHQSVSMAPNFGIWELVLDAIHASTVQIMLITFP